MRWSMSHLFISHIEEDNALARELATGLEADGYSTWHYQRDTVPGAPYLLQVGKAIEECGAVVLIVSPKSLESNQVTSEVVRAFECGKHFIPVLCGITDSEFKERQPLWRQALAASTSVVIPPQGTSAVISRIIDGLRALGLQPGGAVSTPATRTPKHVAQKILAARKGMEGERKQVTVLFADVSGFTSISEEMDPEELHGLMSECLVFLTEEVHRYEGTIAQFLGDGILALFGAPIAHEDAPQRAVHAALGIRERLKAYALKLKPKGIEFNMRLGLNTGLVIVGKIGDDLTMEYTAMGDTVNLASRMQSLAHPGTILVSESTHRLTEGYFGFRPLGEVEVKGKKQPVKAYELLGPGKAKTRLGVSVARGLTPFVGRRKELGHMLDCYEQARKGQGQVVGIVGEAGVGKSRLLLQMRETLPQDDYTYIEGGCFHYGDAVPYLPLLNILRYYFSIDEGEPEPSVKRKMKEKIGGLDRRLETILPPLHDIFSLRVEDEQYLKLDPPHKRERTFEAIRNLLLRQSQDRPLVLAVEDLHWMDKTSEEFLGQFITSLAHSHVLLLLLYRPEYSSPWTSRTCYSQIRVDELSLETSGEMVQAMLHEGKASPELRELILSRAAGNPLFMEELTRSLLDRGFVQRRNGSYVLTAKPSLIQVPETAQGIIGARIDRLDESLKRTMQVASVIGRNFSYPLLEGVLGAQEDIKSHLADLQADEFVCEERMFPELEYIFRHALIQEVAYNSLLIKRRKEIHDRIGQAIESLYLDRLEEFYEVLAYHYSRSENPEKAFQYLRQSSIKTGARNSIIESVRLGREAIDLLNRMPQTDENKKRGIEMRLLLSGPLGGTGQMPDALQMLEEGARLAEEVGDNRSLADLCGTIGLSYTFSGATGRGVEYAERAFQAADRTGDVVLMATNMFELCQAYTTRGDHARIVEAAPRIIDLLEKEHMSARSDLGKYYNFNLYSTILSYYGASLACLGEFGRGQAVCERACRFAEEIGNIYAMVVTHLNYSALLLCMGDGRGAEEDTENALRYAERGQLAITLGIGPTYLGCAYYLLGELDSAREHLERRLEIHRSMPHPLVVSLNYWCLSMLSLDSGDLETARRHIEESLRLARLYGEKHQEGRSTIALGRVIAKADRSQSTKAEGLIQQGIKTLEELQLKPYEAEGHLYLGELYADTGQKEKALEALNKAREMFQEMGMDYWLARTEKALEKLKAVD
jgi:class 3 adenylate cyclase/tetratricopeptide (TPR) repeat protein